MVSDPQGIRLAPTHASTLSIRAWKEYQSHRRSITHPQTIYQTRDQCCAYTFNFRLDARVMNTNLVFFTYSVAHAQHHTMCVLSAVLSAVSWMLAPTSACTNWSKLHFQLHAVKFVELHIILLPLRFPFISTSAHFACCCCTRISELVPLLLCFTAAIVMRCR